MGGGGVDEKRDNNISRVHQFSSTKLRLKVPMIPRCKKKKKKKQNSKENTSMTR